MRSWLLLVLVLVPPTVAVAPDAAVDRNAERVRTGPSPASAGLALSLVLAGAHGAIEAAIGAVLGTGGLDAAGIARRNRGLLDSVRNRSRSLRPRSSRP